MMKMLGTTAGVLFGAVIVAALGYGAYWLLDRFIGWFDVLEPQTAAMIAILTVVALIAASIVAGGAARAGRQAMAAQLRGERAESYRLLVDLWDQPVRGREVGEGGDQLDEVMHTLNLRLALYGSPSVIKAHERLQGLRRDGRLGERDGREALAAALLAVRAELGSGNTGVDAARLVQLLAGGSAPKQGKGIRPEAVGPDAEPHQGRSA